MSESQGDELPPQKRQRTDNDGDSRTRSEYWFEDGNIILQAEDTLFRIHRSVLSRSSQIFQDTFGMPQPSPQEIDSIQGCPVVSVSDTAEDIGNLISLLYDGEKTLNFGSQIPVKTLGSMLRLGRKYVIPYLENKALESLHHSYPITLRDWDARHTPEVKYELDTITEHISIAHEFQLFTILPAAYANYLQLQNLEDIPNDARIPEKARQNCIIGYARIQGHVKRSNVNAVCPPLILPSSACSGSKCETVRWGVIKHLRVWVIEEVALVGVFEPWESSGSFATDTLCSQCRTETKKLVDRVRSKVWGLLPTYFGLPRWSDLKDE